MSDFISEYGEQLRQAGWRRLKRRRRLAGLATVRPTRRAAVALLALFVAAPAVAATGVWRPLLGDGTSPPPTASSAPAAASQRAILSVLRRPQQPADRGAQTRYALKFLGASVADVRTNEIRLLHVESDGRGIVLIPVGRYGLHPPGDPAIPRRQAGSDGLCLFAADQHQGQPAGGGFGCYSTQQLVDGRASAGLGSRVYGLVPDGVEKIKISLADRTQTLKVDENFFIYSGSLGAGEVQWLGEQGNVLRTFPGAPHLPTPPDPAKGICDAAVPRDQCPSGRYAGPNGLQRGRPATTPSHPPQKAP